MDNLKKIEALTEKVAEEERALHALTTLINDGFWDWHYPTAYEYMSPRFWEILGYDYRTKTHNPKEWQGIIHPDDLQAALVNLTEHIDSKGKVTYYQVVRYKHGKTGKWVKVLCRGSVISWKGDDPTRIVGTHTLLP